MDAGSDEDPLHPAHRTGLALPFRLMDQHDPNQLPPVYDRAAEGSIVVHRITGGADEPPLESWQVFFDSGLSTTQMRQLVQAIAYNFEQRVYEPHIVNEHRTDVEWGASSSWVEYILEITQAVPAELIYAGLGYALKHAYDSVPWKPEPEPITIEGADAKCRQRIATTYSIDAGSLHRTGESVEDSDRKVTLFYATDDGTRYTASVSLLADLYLTTHVARQTNGM